MMDAQFVCLALCQILAGEPTADSPFSPSKQVEVLASTVRVVDRSPRGGGSGTGAIIGCKDDSVFILTAFHVVDPGTELEVHWFGSASRRVCKEIDVLATTPAADLAVLRVHADFQPRSHLKIKPTRTAFERPISVLSAGCTDGAEPTCALEVLNGPTYLRRSVGMVGFWVTSGRPVRGRSGGPLVDEQGFLIGVCRGVLMGNATAPTEGLYSSLEQIHSLLRSADLDYLLTAPRAENALVVNASSESAGGPVETGELHSTAQADGF